MGIWRKVGHALFPAIVPSRSRADKAKSDFRRGKRTSAKAAEDYARDRRQADDDARAASKARREAKRARELGLKATEPKPSRKADAAYRQAWMEHRLSRPGRRYADNFDFFNNLPMMRNEDEDTRERLWRSYLDNMVSGRHRRDSPSNPFWRESGISIRDFDWDDWRETMGYGQNQ
jgi:hypothetical protein